MSATLSLLQMFVALQYCCPAVLLCVLALCHALTSNMLMLSFL
jgi:hypothetical protein